MIRKPLRQSSSIETGSATRRPQLLLIAFCLFCSSTTTIHAQLGVLSRGDTDLKWREAQLEILDQQLAAKEVDGNLREELSAQRAWLKSWAPDKLTDKPILSGDRAKGRFVEPIVDPEKRATALRRRLLGEKARPTVKDTKKLEALLAEFSGDIGVRQLHLHWLDQRQYRKDYADEIAEAASRLAGLLEQVKPQTREIQVARVFCLYRRGRALAYRELPEVVAKKPIENPKDHEAKLLGTHAELVGLVGSGRPEFILLEIRMLRRDRWFGRALQMLETHGEQIDKQWFLKKRRDLLKELGWEKAYEEAAAIYATEFPNAVAEEVSAE